MDQTQLDQQWAAYYAQQAAAAQQAQSPNINWNQAIDSTGRVITDLFGRPIIQPMLVPPPTDIPVWVWVAGGIALLVVVARR